VRKKEKHKITSKTGSTRENHDEIIKTSKVVAARSLQTRLELAKKKTKKNGKIVNWQQVKENDHIKLRSVRTMSHTWRPWMCARLPSRNIGLL
jgi:hypothetical protein